MPELSFRTRRILYAAVTEYITTGEPVGSRKLARRYGLEVSPATIRNELGDLEDQGFLVQPHTSAGRVPTDKGFRAFVDALVRTGEVRPHDKSALLGRLGMLRPGVDDLPREAGRILSALTGGASVVHTPPAAEQRVAQLRWLPLRPGQLLAVLVTRGGAVENRVVSLERVPDALELESLHNYLASLVGERTLMELRDLVARAAASERSAFAERARQMVEATALAGASVREVVIEGQTRLLGQPDFDSVEKMRGVLNVLAERERLLELLDRTLSAGGVQVLIGAETQLAETQDLSLITASYGQPGATAGTLGVLAPTRTDYQKVVPLVGFAAGVLTEMLEKKH
ncbi:MAG TPA: heat-inducible transcriptional repressor HrcA [Polyangiales bacterium]